MAGTSPRRSQRPARSTRCQPVAKLPAIRRADPAGVEVGITGLTWRPARRRTPVLNELDLHIPAGQRVLLTGPSGAGKSTLLRAIAGLLLTAAEGDLSGRVLLDGVPVDQAADRPVLLFQDPIAGIVADTVGRDVAFGLENRGISREAIWPLVRGALQATEFPYPEGHPTSALSGGETQRLALAGGLVLGGRVLLLDEPTSMLDPASASSVRAAIRRHVDAVAPTTVIVDHDLEPWLDFAERIVVLGIDGELVADGPARQVLIEQRESLARQGVWVPGAATPELLVADSELVGPWAARGGDLVWAEGVTLEMRNRLNRRTDGPTRALSGVDAVLTAGSALAITGRSGAGKSSLLSVLAGLRRPSAGRVVSSEALRTARGREPFRWHSRDLASRLAWVPQAPEHGIVTHTVQDEVLASSLATGREMGRARRRAGALLELFGLSGLTAASPYHLSGGEQRRLMLAAALVHGPNGLLLDEPTVGQDRSTWAAVVGTLAAARSAGAGVAVATHDARVVDVLADATLALERGVVAR